MAERDHDDVVEALRQAFCSLPRYSFHIDDHGGVRKVPDRSGNWVEFQSAHELFDHETVDAAIAKLLAKRAIVNARA